MKLFTKLMLAMMLMVFFGCTSPNELSMQNLRTGTNGIAWKFLAEQPPQKIFENDRFLMTLELHNDGAATAKNAVLAFGVPQEYVSADTASATIDGKPSNLHFELEGKSLRDPNGATSVVMFPAQAKSITTSKKQEITAQAQLCYDYQTLAETTVCVNYNPSGFMLRITACKPKAVSMTSQGGPVAVTKIDVAPKYLADGSVGSSFIITLQNKGSGKVVDVGHSNEACSATRDIDKLWDRVRIAAVLGGNQIKCKKDVVRLENNKAEVTCEGGVPQTAGPYAAPLQVYADYGYTQTLSTKFMIEHISS